MIYDYYINLTSNKLTYIRSFFPSASSSFHFLSFDLYGIHISTFWPECTDVNSNSNYRPYEKWRDKKVTNKNKHIWGNIWAVKELNLLRTYPDPLSLFSAYGAVYTAYSRILHLH
jgi:hypothetical protein